MKKAIIAILIVAVVAAGAAIGIPQYIAQQEINGKREPKDAVYSTEYSLDHAPAETVPAAYTVLYQIEHESEKYDVYGYVGEGATLERRVYVRKDTVMTSEKRGIRKVTDSKYAFAVVGKDAGADEQPDTAAILAALTDENFLSEGKPEAPVGKAQAVAMYTSDEDVTYTVKAASGDVIPPEEGSTAYKLTVNGGDSYYAYGKLAKSRMNAFFPSDDQGNIQEGALPTDKLYVECTLTGTETVLETDPQTEEAQKAKDALIEQHKEERLAAEEAARIAAEEEAARKAAEEAAAKKKAEEEAAKKKAAEEAAKKKAEEEAAKKKAEEEAKKQEEAGKKDDESGKTDDNDSGEKYKKAKYYIAKNLKRYIAYGKKYPKKSARDVVQEVNCGIDSEFYTNIKTADTSKGYQMLVNKFNKLKGYTPKLTTLGEAYGKGKLETKAAAAFKKMVDAAKKDGVTLKSVSPYRSNSTQKSTYNYWVKKYGSQAKADRYSARPGHSEHETGLAVDINCASGAKKFAQTAAYKWLDKHAHEYGFILRYPEGKEYLTGYGYESWHWRYVGPEHAKKFKGLGIVWEEYYAYYIDK